MANTKISALTALTGADLANDDAFAVVDTSAVATKSITVAELKLGIMPAPGPIGGTTPSTGAFTTLSATGVITGAAGLTVFSDFSTNLFVGYLAGAANTSLSITQGRQNTFIGSSAGQSNTTGYASTNVGFAAGGSNTTGITNTNIGYQAGQGNVTGSSNTNLGTDAGSSNTVSDNIFIGYHAGMNPSFILTGVQNICIGNEVANLATSAHNNVTLGYRAGYGFTTGYENVLNGSLAGFAITTGYQNTVIGKEAGKTFTTGYNNTFVGYRAGFSMQTSSYQNTGVGNLSLFGVTTGISNTALGANSGQKVTTGSTNTFVGNAAGNGAGQKVDATNSTAIGNGANTTASNQVVIGDANVTETILRGTVTTGGYTVATLPAAGTAGRRAYVTDATAPTFLGTLTGGGAVVTPVFDNGVAWVAG